MIIQVFSIVATVQRLLYRLCQSIILHPAYLNRITRLLHRQAERGVIRKINAIFSQKRLNRLVYLVSGSGKGFHCRRGQRGWAAGSRKSIGIAHLQVLAAAQHIKLLVISPGPFILRHIRTKIWGFRILIFIPNMQAGVVISQIFCVLFGIMLPNSIRVFIGNFTKFICK